MLFLVDKLEFWQMILKRDKQNNGIKDGPLIKHHCYDFDPFFISQDTCLSF